MAKKTKKINHTFYFPNQVGKITIELNKGNFIDFTSSELKDIGGLLRDMFYGIAVELPVNRKIIKKFLNDGLSIFPIIVQNKPINILENIGGILFMRGDYLNSIYIYKIALLKYFEGKDYNDILSLLEDYRATDNIYGLINTINSICYANSKIKNDIENSIKLSNHLYDFLCSQFNDNDEIIALKAAVADTIGTLYLVKDKIKSALYYLNIAQEFDHISLKKGYANPVSIRLTIYKIGEAYLKLGEKYFFDKEINKYIEKINEFLSKSIECFENIDVLKSPKISDGDFLNAELKEVLDLSTKGILKARSMLNILKGGT